MENQEPQIRLGTVKEAEAIAGISRSEIFRRIAAGLFPKPIRYGARCTRWPLHEIEQWARERLAARGNTDAEARVLQEGELSRERERQRAEQAKARKAEEARRLAERNQAAA